MSDPIIQVENLSKKYMISHQQGGDSSFREVLAGAVKGLGKRLNPFRTKSAAELAQEQATQEEFWALKEVSFDIQKGDRVGIIGRNGAGKSTLLKILSRITEPSQGEIRIRGRVASLLEVGTGFHGELSGRENIFLNGAILGMSKIEITRKFDEIVAFSEVEKFLDTPVKRYSSGMYVRLAFAVAAHLEPEVLIVDEVLAVGDVQFQKKCLGKMEEVGKEGRTILFVSHQMTTVRKLCQKGILLNAGTIAYQGDIAETCARYLNFESLNQKSILTHAKFKSSFIDLYELKINGSNNDLMKLEEKDESLKIEVIGRVAKKMRVVLEVQIADAYGSPMAFFTPSLDRGIVPEYPSGDFYICEKMSLPRIMKGVYYLNIYLTDPNIAGLVDIAGAVRIECDGASTALGQTFDYLEKGWILLNESINL
jgi:lipopolysaccharide transport system ATP-binding protein